MIDYCNQKLDTKLPKQINEKSILSFDSNFESGNLDSVYVHNINQKRHEYNLLMKVDTNTCGNTHWFYFKVTNFKVGELTYRFNILNFNRNIQFYQYGMNVMKRAEALHTSNSNQSSEWEYGSC